MRETAVCSRNVMTLEVITGAQRFGENVIKVEPALSMATEADSVELADLVNLAGEELPLCIWEGLAKEAEDFWEIGNRR